jgi:RNA polymerase sigma factor (sigma-70 family)
MARPSTVRTYQHRGPSNADLLAACAEGDQGAWQQVVDRFSGLIWSVAHRHRLSPTECEDVCQATWSKLVQKLDTIRDPERLGDWLATVARNEALKQLNRGSRLVVSDRPELFDRADERATQPEDEVLRAELHARIRQALHCLSPQCQALLELMLADPPASYEEAAERLDLSAGSIGPIRTRCLRRLREALAA